MQEFNDFKEDCDELLVKFVDTGSVRFDRFSKLFQDANFGLVYYGLTEDEAIVFTQIALNTVVQFTQPQFNFQVRIGGLYLLHALFTLQSCKPTIKIRVSIKQWKELLKLVKEIKSQNHHDADFIFYQLYAFRAYYITASESPMLFNRPWTCKIQSDQLRLRESAVSFNSYFDEALFEALDDAHNSYGHLKSNFLNENDCTSNDDFLSEIYSDLQSFETFLKAMERNPSQSIVTTENIPSESSARKLKKKAATSTTSLPSTITSCLEETQEIKDQEEVNVAVDVEETAPSVRLSYIQRMRKGLNNPLSVAAVTDGAISLAKTGEIPYLKHIMSFKGRPAKRIKNSYVN